MEGTGPNGVDDVVVGISVPVAVTGTSLWKPPAVPDPLSMEEDEQTETRTGSP